MCVSVCKCDECSFFNYCINMDFESVNKDLLLLLLYMLRQGPYIAVYIYTERCVTMQVFCGLTAKCFGGNYNCDKISAVCMGARRNFSRGGAPIFFRQALK